MAIHDILNSDAPVPRAGTVIHGINPPGTRTPEMLYVGNLEEFKTLFAATRAAGMSHQTWRHTFWRLGEYLAVEHLGDMVALSRGLAPTTISKDYRFNTTDSILVVAITNGFDATSIVGTQFYYSFPAARTGYIQASSPENVTRSSVEGWNTVVFVHIVPDNNGKTMDQCILKVHDMELPVGIVAVIGSVEQSYLGSGVSRPVLRYDERVLLVAF